MPKTGKYKAQTLNCEKIIYLTNMVQRDWLTNKEVKNPGKEAFDVMIFKVKEEVNRPAADINFNYQMKMGEKLTAWTVNPVHSKPGINGLIEKKTCTTYNHNNKLDWMSIDKRNFNENSIYRNSHIKDCDKDMMKGNSGSTLFNEDNEGVSVFSHIYVDKKNQTKSSSGYGTKYQCLGSIVDNDHTIHTQPDDISCKSYGKKDMDIYRENIDTKKHNEVIATLELIQKKIKTLYGEALQLRSGKVNHQIDIFKLVDTKEHPTFKVEGWTWTRTLGGYKNPAPLVYKPCLLYTSPSPRDRQKSRMPSSA